MLAKTAANRDVSPVKREDQDRAMGTSLALSGARRGLALVWVLAVVGIYLAVREFGLALLH
jgi:hypothetical protein